MMDGTYDGKDSRIISSSSECETDDDNESEIEEKMK